jgi:hypothetical protein
VLRHKTSQFLHFPIAKGGTKTIAHLSIVEGLTFRSLDRRIYDCQLRKEKKDLIQVRELLPPTLAIKKEVLRGWGAGKIR